MSAGPGFVEIGRNPVLNTETDAQGRDTLKVVDAAPNVALTLAASSGIKAAAVASTSFGGISTTQIAGLTQVMINGSGPTVAGFVTLTLSGLSTTQIAGALINIAIGLPAAVAPVNVVIPFDPPLYGQPNVALKAELSAAGSGSTGLSVTILGKILPAS